MHGIIFFLLGLTPPPDLGHLREPLGGFGVPDEEDVLHRIQELTLNLIVDGKRPGSVRGAGSTC